MPDYQRAKPFDIVQTILNLQKSVKQLQIRQTTPPPTPGGWVDLSASLLNGFTLQADGRFRYQVTGNVIQFDVFHMTMPASTPFVCATLPLTPLTDKQWPVVTSAISGTQTPRAFWSHTTGSITIASVAASAADVTWLLSVPLDV